MVDKTKPKKALHWCKRIIRFAFSNVGLLLITLAYCAIGSAIFAAIEGPTQRATADLNLAKWNEFRNTTTKLAIANITQYFNTTNATLNVNTTMKAAVDWYHAQFTDMVKNYNYKGVVPKSATYSWDFSSGFLFCIATLMLIGFGNVVPITETGQAVLMVYGVVGIVLALLFLAGVGELLATGLRIFYGKLLCRWCTKKRNQRNLSRAALYPEKIEIYGDLDPNLPPVERKKIPKAAIHRPKHVKADMGSGTKHSDQQIVGEVLHTVPLAFVFFVFWAFIVLGGIIFKFQEDWSFSVGLYFSFITLMTIGFGDYVPGMQHVGTPTGNWQMTVAYFYILMGIALITMCVNLITASLAAKAQKTLESMSKKKQLQKT